MGGKMKMNKQRRLSYINEICGNCAHFLRDEKNSAIGKCLLVKENPVETSVEHPMGGCLHGIIVDWECSHGDFDSISTENGKVQPL
jgi:hypothetical protein